MEGDERLGQVVQDLGVLSDRFRSHGQRVDALVPDISRFGGRAADEVADAAMHRVFYLTPVLLHQIDRHILIGKQMTILASRVIMNFNQLPVRLLGEILIIDRAIR